MSDLFRVAETFVATGTPRHCRARVRVLLLDQNFTPTQVLREQAEIRSMQGDRITDVLVAASLYITRTLTAADPQLGRSGAVCPFAAASERAQMISLFVLPIRTADADSLAQAMLELRRCFPAGGDGALSGGERLRASLVLLPFLDPGESGPLLEQVQQTLKPAMIRDGLMIGEFYPGCALPGLNNPFFRPSDTEFSCLALRHMTAGDLPFLLEDELFLDGYLARFGEDGRRRLDTLSSRLPTLPNWALPAEVATSLSLAKPIQ